MEPLWLVRWEGMEVDVVGGGVRLQKMWVPVIRCWWMGKG